jgi:hypothetical protein
MRPLIIDPVLKSVPATYLQFFGVTTNLQMASFRSFVLGVLIDFHELP